MPLNEDLAVQYAAKIHDHLTELFSEDCENHINLKELTEDDEKFKIFLHALCNIAPNILFEKLSGNNMNILEFNHMCNHLCFDYKS